MLEDTLLKLRFNRGDRDALRRIYEKYKDDLLRLAIALLNDVSLAEDAVNDSFLTFSCSADLESIYYLSDVMFRQDYCQRYCF